MRMYAEEDKGIVFFETILSLRKQKHTFIECIPVPWEQFDLLPGYFKVWCIYALRPKLNHDLGVYTLVRGRVVAA